MDASLARDLRPLWRPVYLPSLVYAAGSSILGPVEVLLALQLGLSPQGVTALVTGIGAFSVLSSLASGYVVGWWGESRAVLIASLVAATGLCAAATVAQVAGRGVWAVGCLAVALCLFDVADAVWSIARQGLVAELAPAHRRGLAMNLYGACQRLGRMIGPLVASAILAVAQPQAALPVAGAIVLAATVLLVRARPTLTDETTSPDDTDDGASRWMWRVLVVMGVGILVLSGLRTAKESLLPLWASQEVRLAASTVALVSAATSAMELVLFLPAGLALDRFGRAPVVVTALLLMGAGLALAPVHATPAWLVASAALVGLGDGAGAGIIKTLGVDLAPAIGRAQFLGRWQAIASAGALAAPALATAITARHGLGASLAALGILGITGAAWMAFWTPRYVPRPQN